MVWYEEIGKALVAVIGWFWQIITGLAEAVGISEWFVLFTIIGIILAITGVKVYRHFKYK